jgi:hypothetical protein
MSRAAAASTPPAPFGHAVAGPKVERVGRPASCAAMFDLRAAARTTNGEDA